MTTECPSRAWDRHYDAMEAIAEAEEKAEAMLRMLALQYLFDHDYRADEPIDQEQVMRLVKRAVYKYTTCGASAYFSKEEAGVVYLSSIVEGVEQTTQTYRLEYPFTMPQWLDTLDAIEKEAHEIWMETHGCEHCWGGQDISCEFGTVDPNCTECKGQGIVI